MLCRRYLIASLFAVAVGCSSREPAVAPSTPTPGVNQALVTDNGRKTEPAPAISPATSNAMLHFAFPSPDDSNRPQQVSEHGYMSSESCQSCHPQQHATWHASYHRTMTQLPTPETVHGDFADAVTHFFGSEQRFFRVGEQFMAEMVVEVPAGSPGAGTRPASFQPARVQMPVALVTGSHHVQVYWHPTGRGRLLGMMPYYYLREEQRWVPRNAAFLRVGGPDVPSEWRSWNSSCLRCHSTHPRPRHRGTFATDVAEFGISCEACHGPGEKHVAARRSKTDAGSTITNPKELSSRAASQVCGQCHSVWQHDSDAAQEDWNQHGSKYRPGDALETTRQIVVPSRMPAHGASDREALAGRFWSDGMVRVSGREYNGLVDSPCFERGELSCLSCHTMHKPADDPRPLSEWANDQLKREMDGNRACTQCHEQFTAADRLAAHSHHAAGSAGSQCYNCHMPHTTYGILKAMRSHQIDSPDVAKSVATGRPNGCNLCHLDQSLEWTAGHLDRWYGIKPPELSDDQRKIAAAPLWLLSGDAGQRALIAWSMNWPPAQEASGKKWLPAFLAQLLTDPYPAVRLLAHRALRRLPGYETLEYDFVGSNESQEAASRTVREQWDRQARAAAEWSEAVRQALEEFSRLAAMRDNRSMFLQE